MKAYSEMMEAIWTFTALANGFQTSKVLSRDILAKLDQYKSFLQNDELDNSAVKFCRDSLSGVHKELQSYLDALTEINAFLCEATGGSEK